MRLILGFLGLENAALGLRPRAVFSRPRSQFFTIRTSQPANNIYVFVFNIAKSEIVIYFQSSTSSSVIAEITVRLKIMHQTTPTVHGKLIYTIIIKFGYKASCHWLKERAL